MSLFKNNDKMNFNYFTDYRSGEIKVYFLYDNDIKMGRVQKALMYLFLEKIIFLKIKSLREVIENIETKKFFYEKRPIFEIQYLLDFAKEASDKVETHKIFKTRLTGSIFTNYYLSIVDFFIDLSNRIFLLLPKKIKNFFKKRYFIQECFKKEQERLRDYKIRRSFDHIELRDFLNKNYRRVSPWIWFDKKSDHLIFYDISQKPFLPNSVRWTNSQVEEVVLEWLKIYLKENIDHKKIIFKNVLF